MALHRATQPDWQNVPLDQRNVWQRYAPATKGAVAPANAVSLAGALLSIYGLFLILDQSTYWQGLIYILIGRLTDVADGYIADITGTKSPFGEATDATLDKVVLGLALIFLIAGQFLPAFVAIILFIHTVYNTLVGFLGYFKKLPVHPSRAGKYSAAAEWLSIGLFLGVYGLSTGTPLNDALNILAWAIFIVFLVLALPGSYTYTRDYLQKSRREK